MIRLLSCEPWLVLQFLLLTRFHDGITSLFAFALGAAGFRLGCLLGGRFRFLLRLGRSFGLGLWFCPLGPFGRRLSGLLRLRLWSRPWLRNFGRLFAFGQNLRDPDQG